MNKWLFATAAVLAAAVYINKDGEPKVSPVVMPEMPPARDPIQWTPELEAWIRENHPPVTRRFHGYVCTDDCSGHEAGYDWAEENEITAPDDCDGNSDSFVEGCQAYAEEQVEAE